MAKKKDKNNTILMLIILGLVIALILILLYRGGYFNTQNIVTTTTTTQNVVTALTLPCTDNNRKCAVVGGQDGYYSNCWGTPPDCHCQFNPCPCGCKDGVCQKCDCSDVDIAGEYLNQFGRTNIDTLQAGCLAINPGRAEWRFSRNEVACSAHRPTYIDCNSVAVQESKRFCESLGATYQCNNEAGYHGCFCKGAPITPDWDCGAYFEQDAENQGYDAAICNGKCSVGTCEKSGGECGCTDYSPPQDTCSGKSYSIDPDECGEYNCLTGTCTANLATRMCQCSEVPPQICTDSDRGLDYWVKGNTVGTNGYYTDYCERADLLIEYYCANNMVLNYGYYCSCYDGKCATVI